MTLTNKQLAFVEQYLVDFNATQAAIRVGYSEATARQQGSRLLTNVDIQAAIREKIMTAEEVLTRLTDIARGDFADIFDITQMGFVIDLAKAKENGKTKLIKRIKQRTTISTSKDGAETEIHDIEVELHSAHEALRDLGKFHKLFTDKVDLTSNGESINNGVTDEGFDRAISSLADALRESLSRSSAEPESPVDAAEQTAVAGTAVEG